MVDTEGGELGTTNQIHSLSPFKQIHKGMDAECIRSLTCHTHTTSHIASGVCSRRPAESGPQVTQAIKTLLTAQSRLKAPELDRITQVWGLLAAAFVRYLLSHRAWIMVIVVMVAMLGVCNLQAGFMCRY